MYGLNLFRDFCLFFTMCFFRTAYCGGLLSLFLGFSIVSIVEVFYFLSIRPYSNHLQNVDRRRRCTIRDLFGKIKKFKIRGTESTIADRNASTSDDNTRTVNNVLFPHID